MRELAVIAWLVVTALAVKWAVATQSVLRKKGWAFPVFIIGLGLSGMLLGALGARVAPWPVGGLWRPWLISFVGSAAVALAGASLLTAGVLGAPRGTWRAGTIRTYFQWGLEALGVGLMEEYYFRGVWGGVCRQSLGLLGGALVTNGVFALLVSPGIHWIRRPGESGSYQLLRMLTLFGFGLSMSWAYQATRSLAIPAGIHVGFYAVYRGHSRPCAGRAPTALASWMGREDPALGLGPVAVYWGVAYACAHLLGAWR